MTLSLSDSPIDYNNVISTGGIIIAALITAFASIQIALLNTTRRHAKATREQTENDHADGATPNLRVNIDSNQAKVMSKLNTIGRTQRTQGNKIDTLFHMNARQNERLAFLEDTHTREQIQEIVKEQQNDQ